MLVSVIIPVYNSESTIRETILSVTNQSYKNLEIIVVDDGSTDNSGKVILAIDDPRIKYIHQSNQGSPIAKNLGISIATGEYVQFLDSDDLISADKIENQLLLIGSNDRVLSFCRTRVFYEYEDFLSNSGIEIGTKEISVFQDPRELILHLFGVYNVKLMIQPNAYLTPMEIIRAAGPWSVSLARSPDDDSEFFYRVLLKAKRVVFDGKSVNYYRKSLNKLSGGKSISHAFGALKTVELNSKLLLQHFEMSLLRDAIIMQISNVAYNYSMHHPAILSNCRTLMFELLNETKFGNCGGTKFRLLSKILGFEQALKVRKLVVKFS